MYRYQATISILLTIASTRLQAIQLHLFHTCNSINNYEQYPDAVTADAGYGSEQNLQYVEDNAMEGYVKYSYFDKEQSSAHQDKHPFAPSKLYYNKDKDCYYCPMGQAMQNTGTYTKTTAAGFEQHLTKYQACLLYTSD